MLGATETTTRGLILAGSVLFTVFLYSLHSRCVGYTFPKSVRLRDQRATLPQLLKMATFGWVLGTTCNTVSRVGHRQTRVYVQANINMVLWQRMAGLLPHPTKVVDVFFLFFFFCNRAVSLLHLHALLVSQRLFCRPYGVHIGRKGSFKTCSRPIAGISVCIFCRKGYWEGAEGGGMVSRQVWKRIVVKCCASARRATVQIGCDSAIFQLAASVVVYFAVVLVSWGFATSRGRGREDLLGNALQMSRSDACSSSRPAGESPARVARVTIKCELNIIFFATRPLKLVIQGIQRCSHVRENESD